MNRVATDNDIERRFAGFLDSAKDVLRFDALGTLEQGEFGSQFRVDYLKPSGAIGFNNPEWMVVQSTDEGEINWFIETKGKVFEVSAAKDEVIRNWCERVIVATGSTWRYARINQIEFDMGRAKVLEDLVEDEELREMLPRYDCRN